MNKNKYKAPAITINKVFTKRGDKGKTELIGEKDIYKDNIRIQTYGELDELNVVIGGCYQKLKEIENKNKSKEIINLLMILEVAQNKIFNLGNMLATIDSRYSKTIPQITNDDLMVLENYINEYNNKLPALSSFVLPGGSEINIWFNLARTITRRCERSIVKLHRKDPLSDIVLKYINRISDAFFVWGRWINFELGINEKKWNPNKENSL